MCPLRPSIRWIHHGRYSLYSRTRTPMRLNMMGLMDHGRTFSRMQSRTIGFLHPDGLWNNLCKERVLLVPKTWMVLRANISHRLSGWAGTPTYGPTQVNSGHRCEIHTGKTNNHRTRAAVPNPGRQVHPPKHHQTDPTASQPRGRSSSWR